MANYANGEFLPRHPEKYKGKYPIRWRSSWELSMMKFLDGTPEVIGWQSETISIPYQNPLTGKWSMYIPDFLVAYMDKNGKQHVEMIEIKPAKESPEFAGKVNQRTKLVQAINAAKWTAAIKWCARNKMSFRVMTEKDLFAFKRSGSK